MNKEIKELIGDTPILGEYRNGNYDVVILVDGTKIRYTDDDELIPEFAENCDVKITDKCSMGCPFCYEGCTKEGKHADLLEWHWLDSLHPWTELALNGNDLDHPQMDMFLQLLKIKHIIANITVQEKQLIAGYDKIRNWQKDGLIHGIGVSFTNTSNWNTHKKTFQMIQTLDNVVFHTIAGVTGRGEYECLADLGQKVLVLGYKDLGRGIDYKESHDIQENMTWLNKNLKSLWSRCAVLSFDNLALEQLNVRGLLTDEQWEKFYMGDDGQYTFYMDLVKWEYAKNSLAQERFHIGDKTIDEMFKHVRTL